MDIYSQSTGCGRERELPMVLIERLVECGDQVRDITIEIAWNNDTDDVVEYLERVRMGKKKGKGCLLL